ncbi:MAG: hypothetical protein AMJ91_04660 [candidate division Zixibacteria bacterium SM23_73_3]|nr:MAG: hypothetical protein AMJ91_04660 [candidate division Zixibacteria bacterium SM23_73_3]
MKQILILFAAVLLLFFVFQCDDKKKPNNPELEDPSYYFPINYFYKWTYVLLNRQCVPSQDSFAITAVNKNKRDGASGWDLLSSGGGTTFVYRIRDTIFTKDVGSTPLPAKILVGPIKEGNSWKDARGFDYSIVGFEDVYSTAAGGTYRGCAKIRRTYSGDPKVSYFWWAPQVGKVKRTEIDQVGQCVSGEELRRLDKRPDFP